MGALECPEEFSPTMVKFADELEADGYRKVRDKIARFDPKDHIGWVVFESGEERIVLYTFSDVSRSYGDYTFRHNGMDYKKPLKKFTLEELREFRTGVVAQLL